MGTCLAVVRIRGTVNVPKDIEDTLKMLRLHRTNYATLVEDSPAYLGMLKKVSNYITWGEVSPEIIYRLLKERGELIGGRRLTEELVKKMGFNSIKELAEKLWKTEVKLNKIKLLKPVFRLHPPKHGYEGSVKKPYRDGGELGYRGNAINDLLDRMI